MDLKKVEEAVKLLAEIDNFEIAEEAQAVIKVIKDKE